MQCISHYCFAVWNI